MGSLFDRPAVLIVLLVGLVLIFGSKRLPDAARGIGRSLRIFKAETKGLLTDDDGQALPNQTPVPAQQPVAAPPAAPQVAAPQPQPMPAQPMPAQPVQAQPGQPAVQVPPPPAEAPVAPQVDPEQRA
jgi:sec-independent protein translocase protein TatA